LILPSSFSLFVWFPLFSLSCMLLLCFSMLEIFSRAFGLLCFALEMCLVSMALCASLNGHVNLHVYTGCHSLLLSVQVMPGSCLHDRVSLCHFALTD
jgi:hypothetical protein